MNLVLCSRIKGFIKSEFSSGKEMMDLVGLKSWNSNDVYILGLKVMNDKSRYDIIG